MVKSLIFFLWSGDKNILSIDLFIALGCGGPKVCVQMLIWDRSLTRAWSIGRLFTVWQDFSLTSLLLKGIISLHQMWNTLSETKLWTTLSHITSLLRTNEAASMLLVCHLTDCASTSACCPCTVYCTMSKKTVWPDQSSWEQFDCSHHLKRLIFI